MYVLDLDVFDLVLLFSFGGFFHGSLPIHLCINICKKNMNVKHNCNIYYITVVPWEIRDFHDNCISPVVRVSHTGPV